MSPDVVPTSDLTDRPGSLPADDPAPQTRRAVVAVQFRRLVLAIRAGDDAKVEQAIVALSQRSRLLAPLALIVGAFSMLFQGIKLLVTNWRLTLVQILPAMWIWAAMLDLKAHALHGREFHIFRGPLLAVVLLVIAGLTAGSFYLNAVFAFAISRPGPPEIRPAFTQARVHLRTILAWGVAVGLALGFATMVVDRWGKVWFSVTLGVVVGVMMVAYVAVPARLVGVKSDRSRRDKLAASAVGGAIGALVCAPRSRSAGWPSSCSARTGSSTWPSCSWRSLSSSRPVPPAPSRPSR